MSPRGAPRRRVARLVLAVLAPGAFLWGLSWFFTNPDMVSLGQWHAKRAAVIAQESADLRGFCDKLFEAEVIGGDYSGYSLGWVDRRSFVRGCVHELN